MSTVRVRITGARDLLTSNEVARLVYEQASRIAQVAGAGYASDSYMTSGRAVASAFTDTPRAMRDNAKTHRLLLALGGQ